MAEQHTSSDPHGDDRLPAPEEAVDVEESGAGYGNHGEADEAETSQSGRQGQAGVSGGMSDTDRG